MSSRRVYAGQKWCRRGESNPRPRDYETLALPLSYAGTVIAILNAMKSAGSVSRRSSRPKISTKCSGMLERLREMQAWGILMFATTRVRSQRRELTVFSRRPGTKFFGTAVLLLFAIERTILWPDRSHVQVPKPSEDLAKAWDRVCIPILYKLKV